MQSRKELNERIAFLEGLLREGVTVAQGHAEDVVAERWAERAADALPPPTEAEPQPDTYEIEASNAILWVVGEGAADLVREVHEQLDNVDVVGGVYLPLAQYPAVRICVDVDPSHRTTLAMRGRG